jgi:hypothetical protein
MRKGVRHNRPGNALVSAAISRLIKAGTTPPPNRLYQHGRKRSCRPLEAAVTTSVSSLGRDKPKRDHRYVAEGPSPDSVTARRPPGRLPTAPRPDAGLALATGFPPLT